ncbi:hypothetical protein BZA70DRAFT_278933 [Myxozyma melibiosi]|uniref:PHD-type domain-containing protein n=1 Tax=Myxozyma melibiosi TaxID=54550 RepID=A0ABR1F5D7_9ASCO
MALPPLRFKTATPEVHYLDVSKNTAARRRRLTKKPPRAQGYQLTMPLTPDNFSNSHRGRVPITEGLTGEAAARQAQSEEVEVVLTPSAATPPPPESPSITPGRTREKASAREAARESGASDTTAQTEEEVKEATTSKPAERRASRLSAAHTVDDTTDDPPASETPVLASQSSNNANADTEVTGTRRKRSEMEHTPQPEEQSIRRQKRVKVSPIKKRYGQRENAFGFGPAAPLPSTRASANSAVDDPDDPTKFNDDFCSACGGIGRFLCCEGCPKSFHFTCTDPPYDESNLPEGSWFCKSCHAKRHPPPIMPRGLFAELIEQIETRNPACFVLPKEIRERYEGVTSTEFGEYQDVQDTKAKRPRNGFIEEPDPFRLTDKNGKAILCFKCGLSALHDRKMISCDYCPLHWHLDCLDPPMSSIPTISQRKWRCPNHVNRELIKCRRLRNAKLVSVSLRRGFINNGDIEVENESSDDDGNAAGNEVLVKPSRLHFFDNWSEDPFNKTSAFDRRKIATYTIKDEEQNVVYRVSERGLVLDFLDKVNLLPHTRKRAPRPVPLSELDRLVVLPYQEREFVRNLAYFNQQFTPEAVTRQSMSSLLDAALALDDTVSLASSNASDDEEGPVSTTALETTSRSSSTEHEESLSANTAATEQVETEEVMEDKETLLAIQRLMRVKGKDALMKFLLG